MAEQYGTAPETDSNLDVTEVNLTNETAQSVQAQTATLTQSRVQSVTAQEVNITAGGAQTIDAVEVRIEQGGAVLVRGQSVSISQGGALLMMADAVTFNSQSGSPAVLAKSVKAENQRTVFLLANHVEGDVRTTFDTQGALLFGTVMGAIIGLLLFLRDIVLRK
jgi:hypothetical protein